MGPGIFRGVDAVIKLALVLVAIFVPLGLWKLAELLWWVVSHLHWGAP